MSMCEQVTASTHLFRVAASVLGKCYWMDILLFAANAFKISILGTYFAALQNPTHSSAAFNALAGTPAEKLVAGGTAGGGGHV